MEESTEQRVVRIIGRPLEPSERARYPSVDEVPAEVRDLVAVVTMAEGPILATRYLFERVGGTPMDLKGPVQWFTEAWMARWTPADEEAARTILGRELGPDDKLTFGGEANLSAHIAAVTRKLARRDYTLACKYLLERVSGLHLMGAMAWVSQLAR